MKLATLALVAATVAIPAAAFADSSQPNSSPGAAAPAGHMQTQGAPMNQGVQAGDSSLPGSSLHEAKPNGKVMMKKGATTTGSKAGDSSLPGASMHPRQ